MIPPETVPHTSPVPAIPPPRFEAIFIQDRLQSGMGIVLLTLIRTISAQLKLRPFSFSMLFNHAAH
jgi:hypothetical protein